MCFIERETQHFILKFWENFPWRESGLKAHGMKSDEKPFFCQIHAIIFWAKMVHVMIDRHFSLFLKGLNIFLNLRLSLIVTLSCSHRNNPEVQQLNLHTCRGVASPDCPGGQSWWASRWRVSANCALARTGGCLRGDVPPSEAGRFWNFDTEFTQFSDNFYAKFIPFLPPFPLPLFFSLFPFLLFSFPFLSFFSFSFPFPFPFPFLFLSLLPSLFSFLFLSLFFLSFPPFSPSLFLLSFPIFGVRGGSLPPLPPHWLRPCIRDNKMPATALA